MGHVNRRAKAILTVICLACNAMAFATGQVPETVLINGGVYELPLDDIVFGNKPPLESLWKSPAAKLGLADMGSGHWRRYEGLWEVHGDTLYLRALEAWHEDRKGEKADMKAIFVGRFQDGRVQADWLNGELLIRDEMVRSTEGGEFTLPFAQGRIVPPATAQLVGIEPRARARPWWLDRTPATSEAQEARTPDREPLPQNPDMFVLDGVVYYLPAEFSVRAFPQEVLWPDPKTRPHLSAAPNGTSSHRHARGYRAIWEVHEGGLYMLALDAWRAGNKVHLRWLLPGRFRNGRVTADWFSGDLALITDEGAPVLATVIKEDPPLDAPKVVLKIKDGNVVSVTHMPKETK